MITLYHGSNIRITDIDLSQCNPYKDFGQAFYFTTEQTQAMEMALAKVDVFGGEPYRFTGVVPCKGQALYS